MTPGPILEELWRVKDELAREAGYDVDRIFSELRAAEAQIPGPLIHTAKELRCYVAERKRHSASGLALNEEPSSRKPKPQD